MGKSTDLQSALKTSDPSIQQFVTALENENKRLHEKIAKLEAKNVSAKHQIIALLAEIEKAKTASLENTLELLKDVDVKKTTNA